jgi:spore germination protein KB
MRKEQLNDKEGICLLTIFVTGSTLIIGIGSEAENDAWIAGIVAIFMSVPMLMVYARILSLFQGKDLFDILEIIMGKILGKAAAVIYIWYAFHLGSLVIRNFGEFLATVAMRETPMLVSILILTLTCIVGVRSGIEVMARTAAYLMPIFMGIIAVVQILAIPKLEPSYLKPILGGGIVPVLKGAFYAFSFPFTETVIMTGAFYTLKKKSHYKVFLSGVLLAGATIILLTTRNILVLGFMRSRLFYASHTAVAMISVGEFLQRIEVTVSFTFAVGVFIKAAICMFVACKGISKVIGLHDYKSIVIQTGLLMAYFAYTVYDNTKEMFDWAMKVYPFYAFPFQVIMPLIIWILAEIKAKKMKEQSPGKAKQKSTGP